MRRAMAAKDKRATSHLSLSQCEALLRYAIDRTFVTSASSLSPRDRAKLASAAAILNQIREALEEHGRR